MASNFPELTRQLCPNCNGENEPMALLCEYCEEMLPVEPLSAELTRGTWTCNCSFVNSYPVEHCACCGTRHSERTPTYCPTNSGQRGSDDVERALVGNAGSDDSASELYAKVEKVRKQHSQKGTYFADREFPACDESIYSKNSDPINKPDEAYGWLRPFQIKASAEEDEPLKWTVFDQPKCSDVVMGHVGDCWFITALAAIAERSYLLDKIFVTKKYNPNGIYGLRLYSDGEWVDVIVDDLFPVDKTKKLLFAKAKRKQLWVPLAEKALAKMYGSYAALIGGSHAQGMSYLTGCALTTIHPFNDLMDTLDRSLFYRQLYDAIEEGLLVTAGTDTGSVTKEQYASVQLLPDHSYAILTVTSIYGQELVLVSNIWGRKGWTGSWNEHSDSWKGIPKELRPAEGIGNQEQGIFWMSFEDFIKYFFEITICYTRKNYYSYRIKSKFLRAKENEWEIFQMDINEPCSIDISIQDRDKFVVRTFTARAVIVILDSKWSVIGCTKNAVILETSWTSSMLKAGKYIVCCFSFSKWFLPESKYNFICHSSKEIKCYKYKTDASLAAKVLMKTVIQKGDSSSHFCCGQQTHIYELQHPSYLGRVLAIVNRSPTQAIYITTVPSPTYFNVRSTRSKECENTCTYDIIPPQHCQIIQTLHPGETEIGEVRWNYIMHHESFHNPQRLEELHHPVLSSKTNALHRLMANTEVDGHLTM